MPSSKKARSPRIRTTKGCCTTATWHCKALKRGWRLIGFRSPEGIEYEYLTNDHGLQPGVVAFLYHRRWDKEKYYDCFKNDLAGDKAWGKSPLAIEQQALLGMATSILTRLFLMRRQADLALPLPDATQNRKHEKKRASYAQSDQGILLRAQWPICRKYHVRSGAS